MILHDRYYNILRIKLDGENNKIRYEFREELIEDNQTEIDNLNFVNTVRDTLYQYVQQNKTAIPLIQFIDYFQFKHKRSFPTTRSLRRVMAHCDITISTGNRIDQIVCFVNTNPLTISIHFTFSNILQITSILTGYDPSDLAILS